MGGDDDDIDDLYDKTASRKRGRDDDEGEVETEQSLMAKWKELIAEWHKKKGESSAMQRRVHHLSSKVATAEAAGDEDAFFMRNDLDLVQDNYQKIMKALGNIEEELSEIEKLLRVVNVKLVVDRTSSFVGLEADKPKPKTNAKPDRATMPPPSGRSGTSLMPPPAMMAPPPPKRPSPRAAMMPPPPRTAPNASTAMPPPPMVVQRKSPAASSADTTGSMAPPPPKRSKPIGPPRGPGGGGGAGGGTLAAIRSAVSKPSDGSSNSSSSRPKGIGAAPPPSGFGRGGTSSTDSKEDKWQAPSDQDGSGITKLNQKFQGRY